jgi:HK97 family phage major capsid protein
MRTIIENQIKELDDLIAIEEPTNEQLEQIKTLTNALNEYSAANPFQPKEQSSMNAPLELKQVATAVEKSFFEELSENIPAIKSGASFRKAISSSNTDAAGGTRIDTPAAWFGLVNQALPTRGRLIDYITKAQVTGQSVNFTQLALATNGAAKVKELGAKPVSALTANSVTLQVETFATHIASSKQVLDDVVSLQATIGAILVEGVKRSNDQHAYAQLLAEAGTFVTTMESVQDAALEMTSKLLDAGANQIVVAVNPDDYLIAATTKASTAGSYLGTSPMMAMTMIPSASVTKGTIMGFDVNAVRCFDRMDASVFLGYTGSQFTQNEVTILAENRLVVGVLNPNLVLTSALPVGGAK